MPTRPSKTDPGVARGFRLYARTAAQLLALVGSTVLLGWALDLPRLTSLLPGAPAMAVTTALALLLSALALLVYLQHSRRSFTGLLLSSGVVLLGVLPDWQLAKLTALGVTLLGVNGVLACAGFAGWPKDALSLLLLAIAMIGLAAYGFSLAGAPSEAIAFTPVPVHTAFLFLLAALAWMSAQPDRGMTRVATADSIGGALARRLLLPSLLLPLAFTYLMQMAQVRFAYSAALMTSLAALFTGGSVASLVWWVAKLMDRVERERRETQRMRDSAETDGLTGLPNRRAFDGALEALLRGRRDKDARFFLLMLDLDFFKAYNDNYGHVAGDEALRITARLLRDALRPDDVPARYGGEEFAALLPDSEGAEGLRVAERIVERFQHETWPHRPVTLSIGVAEASAGDDASSLIARADAALYAAKEAGRNRAMQAPLETGRERLEGA